MNNENKTTARNDCTIGPVEDEHMKMNRIDRTSRLYVTTATVVAKYVSTCYRRFPDSPNIRWLHLQWSRSAGPANDARRYVGQVITK